MPERPNRRNWIIAGFASAPAIAIKMTTWFLLPLAALSSFINLLRRRRSFGNTIIDLALYVLFSMSLLLASWYCWPDIVERLNGSPNTTGIRGEFLDPAHFISLIPLVHSSFWGHFGWMNLPIPTPFLIVLDGIGLTGFCVGLYASVRKLHPATANQRSAILILWLSILLVTITFILFNLVTVQPQGRYFYPAIISIGFVVSYGWMTLARARRKLVACTILALMIGIDLLSLLTVILPAYTPLSG